MTNEEIIKYVQYLYDNELNENHKYEDHDKYDWRLHLIDAIGNDNIIKEKTGEYIIGGYIIYEHRIIQYMREQKLKRLLN